LLNPPLSEFHFSTVSSARDSIRNAEVQASVIRHQHNEAADLPRSGYKTKPRVAAFSAATLGLDETTTRNPDRVAPKI